jgi:hypothetical protein
MLGSADEVQEFTCQELLFLRGNQKEEKKDEEKEKEGENKIIGHSQTLFPLAFVFFYSPVTKCVHQQRWRF